MYSILYFNLSNIYASFVSHKRGINIENQADKKMKANIRVTIRLAYIYDCTSGLILRFWQSERKEK